MSIDSHFAKAATGEVYSENIYVSQYGLLSDTKVSFFLEKADRYAVYLGGAFQIQENTNSSQEKLYEKNRAMVLFGFRHKIWKTLAALVEFRTESRSRGGLYAGDIWQYKFQDLNVFSEFYVESMILPDVHNSPISTGWIKQGLRYIITPKIIFDPFLELYLRHSPTPDLGRDTEQARVGLRAICLQGSWTLSTLIYQSYARNEDSHIEGLVVIGGTF